MSTNPYGELPDYQFWRRAVSGIEPFRFDPVVSAKFLIDSRERVATAGSCFAQHISNRLSKIGFNYYVSETGAHLPMPRRRALNYGVFTARFGNIYTTRQLLQLFEECDGRRNLADDVWSTSDGRFVDAMRPQIVPEGFGTPAEVREERKIHLRAVRAMFQNCDIFVFTLGLTEAWRSRSDGTVYPLAPGVAGGVFDPDKYEFINFNILEVMADLEKFLEKLKLINPDVRVVLTVSPVPLIATYENRNVLVASTYSKSVLRVAADMAYRKYDWVEYFPSYEIITGNYNNSGYFEGDYRGVNSLGVDHAMRCFLSNYTKFAPHDRASFTAPVSAPTSEVVCDEEALELFRT